MQTKSRTTSIPLQSETVEFLPTDPLDGTEPFSVDVWTEGYTPRVEYMTPNSGGGRRAWKDFEHYKSFQSGMPSRGMMLMSEANRYFPNHAEGKCNLPLVGFFSQTWGTYWMPYGNAGTLDSGLPAFFAPRADGGFVDSPPGLESLLRRGIAIMLPTVKQELSLLNSIFELKDFKRPIERAVHVLKTSPSWRFAVKKLTGVLPSQKAAFKRKPLKSIVGKATSAHLQTAFAWLPLVSDIMAVKRVMSSTAGRISDLINRAGRRQSKHFRYVFAEFEDTYDEAQGAGWTWQNQHSTLQSSRAWRRVSYKPTVFHAQLEYNYNYSNAQVAHAQLLGHMDALGLNLNPGIIWNAIPFSFVVDWVLGIGPALDRMKVANMTPEINIHRLLWSCKREREILVCKRLLTSPSVNKNQEAYLGRVYQTAYKRRVEPFSLDWYVETSDLSLRELSLGASMVLSSMSRSRK